MKRGYEHDSEYEPESESPNLLDLKEEILKTKPRKDVRSGITVATSIAFTMGQTRLDQKFC